MSDQAGSALERQQPTQAQLELQQREQRAKALVTQVRRPDFLEQIEYALPPTVTKQRFLRATVTALLTNPDIGEATDISIFRALLRCAQDGLLPDGRQAAIAVYRNNKTGKKEASYLPMIYGLIQAAGEYGWTMEARVVYANEHFVHEEGLNRKLEHTPAPLGRDRGELVAAYAIARRGNVVKHDVMYEPEIAKVRAKAQTPKFWNDWPEQMWMKSVGKRLFKTLSLDHYDERVNRLLAVDEMGHEEASAMLYSPPDIEGRVARGENEPATANRTSVSSSSAGADASEGAEAKEGVGRTTPTDVAASAPQEAAPAPERAEEKAARDPADATVPSGIGAGLFEGKTLAQIDAEAGAAAFYSWALERPENYWPAAFSERLHAHVRSRHPDILPG